MKLRDFKKDDAPIIASWLRSEEELYMKGLPWGLLYNKHGQRTDLNPIQIEKS